jgi:hypothetical protein
MGYYEAKFLREAQERPTDWIIVPAGRGRHKLVYIGPAPDAEQPTVATVGEPTDVPYLRVVK